MVNNAMTIARAHVSDQKLLATDSFQLDFTLVDGVPLAIPWHPMSAGLHRPASLTRQASKCTPVRGD